jgi:hypothetical protein
VRLLWLALLLSVACAQPPPEPQYFARGLADFAESNDAAASEIWLIKRHSGGCLAEFELRSCHRCSDEPLCWGIVLEATREWAREVHWPNRRHRYPWVRLDYCE